MFSRKGILLELQHALLKEEATAIIMDVTREYFVQFGILYLYNFGEGGSGISKLNTCRVSIVGLWRTKPSSPSITYAVAHIGQHDAPRHAA